MFEHCKFQLDLDILVQTKDPSTSKDDFVCLTAHAWRIPRIPEATPGSWKDDPLSRKCDSHVSCASWRTVGSRDRAPWLYLFARDRYSRLARMPSWICCDEMCSIYIYIYIHIYIIWVCIIDMYRYVTLCNQAHYVTEWTCRRGRVNISPTLGGDLERIWGCWSSKVLTPHHGWQICGFWILIPSGYD